jgi:hypothetical protein
MVGIRLPSRMLKKIDQIADALSTNRSQAIRRLVEESLTSGLMVLLLRQGQGRRKADRIALASVAKLKADAAQEAANRNPDNVETSSKALRARRDAIDRHRTAADPQYGRFRRRKGVPHLLSEAEEKQAIDWTNAQFAQLRRGGHRTDD